MPILRYTACSFFINAKHSPCLLRSYFKGDCRIVAFEFSHQERWINHGGALHVRVAGPDLPLLMAYRLKVMMRFNNIEMTLMAGIAQSFNRFKIRVSIIYEPFRGSNHPALFPDLNNGF
jgi:hypothetical protein